MCGTRQKSISVRSWELSRGFHSSPGTNFRVGSIHFDEETFYDKLEIHPQVEKVTCLFKNLKSIKWKYLILNIFQSTSREVKEAFYKLSKRYHPDTNADNDEALKKFQSISEAYEVLR